MASQGAVSSALLRPGSRNQNGSAGVSPAVGRASCPRCGSGVAQSCTTRYTLAYTCEHIYLDNEMPL